MSLTRRDFVKAGILFGTVAVFADAFGFETHFIETNEFYIGDATKESRNIKIVQVSDLHLQSVQSRHRELINKLNRLKPELILFTGDAIDNRRKLPILNDFLKLIDKDIKKVAILGNREYRSHVKLSDLKKVYDDNNCELLVNQTKQFSFHNKTISITGIDDFAEGNADIDTAVKDYQKSDYHIILNHCPEYSDIISSRLAKDIHADFILSGHTHGGQINLFGYAPYLPPGSGKYVMGWYNDHSPRLYVSKGVGTTAIPARFWSQGRNCNI